MAEDRGKRGDLGLSRRAMIAASLTTAGTLSLPATAAAAAAAGAGAGPAPLKSTKRAGPDADLALVNGKILTMDDNDSIASAVLIRDGRILEVGSSVGPAKQTVDLKGASVIPGLIDAHDHLFGGTVDGVGYETRDVELAQNISELLGALRARAATVPKGKFITCDGGWNHQGLAEKRRPTRAELDSAAPDHPVWIAETQSEQILFDPNFPVLPGLTNSLGIEFFRGKGVAVDPVTGLVPWGAGLDAMSSTQTEADRRRSVEDGIRYALSLGVTTIHDFGYNDPNTPNPSIRDCYPYITEMWQRGELPLRFRLRLRMPQGDNALERLRAKMHNVLPLLGDDLIRLNGIGEGLGNRADPASVEAAAKLVAEYGWGAHVHSVTVGKPGDNTVTRQQIAAFRSADAQNSIRDLRWSLAHGNYLTPDIARELVELGVGVTGDAWQYTSDPEPVPMGPPWRMLLDAGVKLGAGSDGAGVSGFNPWLTIYYMVTGRINSGRLANPGQTVSRMEALKIHTMGSAWHAFDETKFGSVEPGKYADLAILSADPLTVSDSDLRRITSRVTLQAGVPVYGSLDG